MKVPVSPEELARMVMTSPPKSDWRCTEKVGQDEAQAWPSGGRPDDFLVRVGGFLKERDFGGKPRF